MLYFRYSDYWLLLPTKNIWILSMNDNLIIVIFNLFVFNFYITYYYTYTTYYLLPMYNMMMYIWCHQKMYLIWILLLAFWMSIIITVFCIFKWSLMKSFMALNNFFDFDIKSSIYYSKFILVLYLYLHLYGNIVISGFK